MVIRPGRLEDAPGMAHVIVDTFLASNRGLMSDAALERRRQTWTYEVSARNWREVMQGIATGNRLHTCVYVAEGEDGQILGLALGLPAKEEEAALNTRENSTSEVRAGEIDVLYVHLNHQRRGIGRALAQATAAQLTAWGMTKLYICTPDNNVQGRRFYDKLGGTIVGTRDDYDDGELIRLVVYAWDDIQAFIHA
jgi:ribosomal protein S18 acetylase RimI-like enzyme